MKKAQAPEQSRNESKNNRQLGVIPPDGFMRFEQVISVLCESRTGLYRKILEGEYPSQLKLPGGRTSVWIAEDIRKTVDLIKAGKTWADRDEATS